MSVFLERTTSDPVALFTLILAISTIGLSLATIKLYRAGERQIRIAKDAADSAKDAALAANNQVKLSRRALEMVERPLVFPSKTYAMAGVKQSTNEVIDWTFFAILENAGNTPTRWMFMHTDWYYFAGGIPENFDFSHISAGPIERVPITIGPRGTTWSGE